MEDKKVESNYSIYKTEYLFPEDGDLIYVCKVYSNSEEQLAKLCYYLTMLTNDEYAYICRRNLPCEGFCSLKVGDLRIKCFR